MQHLFNLILIYIFINVLCNYIFGNNFSILSCGIFAWVGKDIKYFRKDLFNILGLYNDSRGGDGCGIYFDDSWTKGSGVNSKYEKLIPTYDLHNTLKLKKYPVIIGHDRKTSVGTSIIENIQPTVIIDDTDAVVYVQAHNGTIGNYTELAKKYNIDLTTGESDSVAMAKLIQAVGFGVLSEYEGSGAFVMYFKETPNILFAFHGRSKLTEYGNETDERPLAYLTFPGKGTYISSDIDHLKNISCPSKNIIPVEFDHNVLYRLEGDSITEVNKIDRSKINMKKQSTIFHKAIPKSPAAYDCGIVGNGIRYSKGIYVDEKRKPVHGVHIISTWGYLMKGFKFNPHSNFELCFIYGILMRNREAYEKMLKLLSSYEIDCSSDFYDRSNWLGNDLVTVLKECSLLPFWRYDTVDSMIGYLKPNTYRDYYKYAGSYYFDGRFSPPLSRYSFTIYNGDINSYTTGNMITTISDFISSGVVSPDEYDFSHVTDEDLQDILKNLEKESIKKDNKVITLPVSDKNRKEIKPPSDFNCADCEVWRYNEHFCSDYCLGIENSDKDKLAESNKAFELAYAYQDDETNEAMGKEVMLDSFRNTCNAINDCIDTYDSLAVDLKDEDVTDVIDSLKEVSTKLNKY